MYILNFGNFQSLSLPSFILPFFLLKPFFFPTSSVFLLLGWCVCLCVEFVCVPLGLVMVVCMSISRIIYQNTSKLSWATSLKKKASLPPRTLFLTTVPQKGDLVNSFLMVDEIVIGSISRRPCVDNDSCSEFMNVTGMSCSYIGECICVCYTMYVQVRGQQTSRGWILWTSSSDSVVWEVLLLTEPFFQPLLLSFNLNFFNDPEYFQCAVLHMLHAYDVSIQVSFIPII